MVLDLYSVVIMVAPPTCVYLTSFIELAYRHNCPFRSTNEPGSLCSINQENLKTERG